MQDLDSGTFGFTPDVGVVSGPELGSERPAEDLVVSTHVLVPAEQLERLRTLAKKTRIAQSEYLREAVDDLLRKYNTAVK